LAVVDLAVKSQGLLMAAPCSIQSFWRPEIAREVVERGGLAAAVANLLEVEDPECLLMAVFGSIYMPLAPVHSPERLRTLACLGRIVELTVKRQ
jgi:hypothetical protein